MYKNELESFEKGKPGTSFVLQWFKMPLATLASCVDSSSNPSCSTFYLAPGEDSRRHSKCLGPYTHIVTQMEFQVPGLKLVQPPLL